MNILVTGGAGFIGSHIVDYLVEDGHKVAVLDNLSAGMEKNVNSAAMFFKADINDVSFVNKVFSDWKPDIVYHMAAQIDVRISMNDPVFDADQNILGSLRLLECCKKHKVKKVIFASTGGAIYGEQEYYPANENHPVNPVSPYGIAKLTVEKYLYYYKVQYGLSYVSLRYANVYGPRQNSKGEAGVVAIFAQKLLNKEPAVINGDGKQTRDFVFVHDIAKYNRLAIQHDIEGIFNIGTGVETTVNEIYTEIAAAAGIDTPPQHAKAIPGEQERSSINGDRAVVRFGVKPEVSVSEGIENTVQWFKLNR
ncbi:MAG: NAD-dependent epimerase/dehydratase family protein [Leptospirales bacterium]